MGEKYFAKLEIKKAKKNGDAGGRQKCEKRMGINKLEKKKQRE